MIAEQRGGSGVTHGHSLRSRFQHERLHGLKVAAAQEVALAVDDGSIVVAVRNAHRHSEESCEGENVSAKVMNVRVDTVIGPLLPKNAAEVAGVLPGITR